MAGKTFDVIVERHPYGKEDSIYVRHNASGLRRVIDRWSVVVLDKNKPWLEQEVDPEDIERFARLLDQQLNENAEDTIMTYFWPDLDFPDA